MSGENQPQLDFMTIPILEAIRVSKDYPIMVGRVAVGRVAEGELTELESTIREATGAYTETYRIVQTDTEQESVGYRLDYTLGPTRLADD